MNKKPRYRLKIQSGRETITEHKNIKSVKKELDACFYFISDFSFIVWDRKRLRETKGRYCR